MKGIDISLNPAEIKRQIDESIEREQVEKSKQAAKHVEAQLDHRARASFFAANPGASEAAYKAIEADLKRQMQLNDTLDHDSNRARLHSIYSDF